MLLQLILPHIVNDFTTVYVSNNMHFIFIFFLEITQSLNLEKYETS